jgi:putative ABC transport system ATP-binding protein
LGYVFQFFQLLPDLSVRENIVLPLLIAGEEPELHRQEIEEVVDVLGLGSLLDRQPHGLSGGEMQRVGIARALAQRPPVLLCDEPTGNLSSKAGEETMRLFSRVRDRYGLSILLVTHNPRDAAFGDRVLFLRDGQLDPSHTLTGPGLDAATVFSRLEKLSI